MSYPIFPVSPLPAGMTRDFFWGENINRFDSGARQAMTSFKRPLMRYDIPWQNFTEVKQATFQTFVFSQQGMVRPFLMKDPYHYQVASVLAVRSGYASGSPDLYLFDTNSFFIRADTTTIASMFSSLSGWVLYGTHYTYSMDTGVLHINTKHVNDVWGLRAVEFFRKCAFAESYKESSQLWNIFNAAVKIEEIV